MITWGILAPISLCAYVYATALRERRYQDVVVSVGFFFAELLWELFNARVGLWSVDNGFYLGLNVEIALMFAIFPLVVMSLPGRRLYVALVMGGLCVAVETWLNAEGLLHWHYWFWRPPHLYLVFIAYALPAWLILYVRGLSFRLQQRLAAATAVGWLAVHLATRPHH